MKAEKSVRRVARLGTCLVCGDKAIIVNYGVLTCQSCKTFFRRNGFQLQSTRPCLQNSSCKITIATRRNCTTCRLKKCLQVGMKPHLIRKQEIRHNQSPSVDIISCNNSSVLRSSDKKLLSNIIHAIHVHSPISKIKRIISDFVLSMFSTDLNMINIVEVNLLISTSIRAFFNSIPDFQILTIFEQSSLLDRNFHLTVDLYAIGIFYEVILINEPYWFKNFISVYGYKMMMNTIRLGQRIDLNLTVIHLMLPVLAFSSNCSIVNFQKNSSTDSLLFGTYHLFASQNIYITILWKYLIYRYGYFESVRRFTQLIQICLDQIVCPPTIHRDLIGNFLFQTKQTIGRTQNEFIPIWGMT